MKWSWRPEWLSITVATIAQVTLPVTIEWHEGLDITAGTVLAQEGGSTSGNVVAEFVEHKVGLSLGGLVYAFIQHVNDTGLIIA